MPKISNTKYVVMAGWDDVPHLDEQTKQDLLAMTPAHLRDARSKGIPTMGSGLIFPIEEERIVIAPMQIPAFWPQIIGIDFGTDHPFAAVWLAWDRDNDCIYVTQCYRVSDQSPMLHAAAIRSMPGGVWIPVAWPHDGLQRQGNGETLEQVAAQYKRYGLNMLPDRAMFDDQSNSVEAGLMDMLDRMQSGRWKVFSTCKDWLEEFRMYHRKDGKIVKIRDDAISASRYALMCKRFAKVKPANNRVNRGGGFTPFDPTMGY